LKSALPLATHVLHRVSHAPAFFFFALVIF
jgi:hypothetical protein